MLLLFLPPNNGTLVRQRMFGAPVCSESTEESEVPRSQWGKVQLLIIPHFPLDTFALSFRQDTGAQSEGPLEGTVLMDEVKLVLYYSKSHY